MSAESARDVLRANREGCTCEKYRKPCAYHEGWDDAIDNAEQHPVELLALLAEPKVCETCGGDGCEHEDGRVKRSWGQVTNEGGMWHDVLCSTCQGSGSVAVDVLDLAVKAGQVEQVGWVKPVRGVHRMGDERVIHEYECYRTDRPVFAAKDGTP